MTCYKDTWHLGLPSGWYWWHTRNYFVPSRYFWLTQKSKQKLSKLHFRKSIHKKAFLFKTDENASLWIFCFWPFLNIYVLFKNASYRNNFWETCIRDKMWNCKIGEMSLVVCHFLGDNGTRAPTKWPDVFLQVNQK